MAFISKVDNGFFYTIQYAPELEDNGWLGKFEFAADVCRAPTRWIAAEFLGWRQKASRDSFQRSTRISC